MLLQCDYQTHVQDMLTQLKWLNIKERINFHKMCLMYKCRNGLVSEYLTQNFTEATHEHETRSRSSNSLTLVKPNNNQLKRSFKYSGAKQWNELNTSMQNTSSLNSFKAAYLKSHFSH